jgi:carbon-monoxide dehydrogenase medium subunit
MKPAKFRYARPSSIEEAYELLERYGEDAQVLAGGQSLLAGLSMRLATPEVLVDIGSLNSLSGIALQGEEVVIGALTCHTAALNSPVVQQYLPLFAEAISHIGHVGIRNRGTFGGSLAYVDPAAELPACVVAHGASVVVGSRHGGRRVEAEAFFTGLMQTALRPGELIIEVRIPVQRAAQTHIFAELARRHGDFALVGIAGLVTLDGDSISEAKLSYFGCVDQAAVARDTSAALVGRRLPLAPALDLASLLGGDIRPADSPGMRAATKLELAAVVTRRALNASRMAASP